MCEKLLLFKEYLTLYSTVFKLEIWEYVRINFSVIHEKCISRYFSSEKPKSAFIF